MAAVMKNLLHHKHTSDPSSRKSLTSSRRENQDETRGRSLRDQSPSSFKDLPPIPPPKDSPSTSGTQSPYPDVPSTPTVTSDAASIFRSGRLSRAGSVYTLSRVSFSSQIKQLTDIQLPDAEVLSSSVSAIPTAEAVAAILQEAAESIQAWVRKASDVLNGLDAGDDAEWAASAGNDGLSQVNRVIIRFESLIKVYIACVESLHSRSDVGDVSKEDQHQIEAEVVSVTESWRQTKTCLENIERQVDLAMDWQKFRDVILADIGTEMDKLSAMIFEMEERRHQTTPPDVQQIDLDRLESAMEDMSVTPRVERSHGSGPSLVDSPQSQAQSPTPGGPREQDLLGVFARLQAVRTQLEFLPMSLSSFEAKARTVFPTGCRDLEDRRDELETQWSKVEADAEALQRELSDDRWTSTFRSASKKVSSFIKSIKTSLDDVDEALDNNESLRHSPATTKRIKQYEWRKQQLCPSVENILTTLDKGIKNRRSINGEVVRLERDVRSQWRTLQYEIEKMDHQLEQYTTDTGLTQQQLRDSVSTIVSTEHSYPSSALLTPGSSPPSSGFASRKDSVTELPPSLSLGKTRQAGPAQSFGMKTPQSSKRFSSLPVPNRTTPASRLRVDGLNKSSSPSSPLNTSSTSGTAHRQPMATPPDNRPRFTYIKNSNEYSVSDYYKSLMSKGKHYTSSNTTPRHSSAPYSPSSPSPRPASRLASDLPTSNSNTSSRRSLNRKRSDLASSVQRTPLSTSPLVPRAKTSMGSHVTSGSSAVKGRVTQPSASGSTTPAYRSSRSSTVDRTGENQE